MFHQNGRRDGRRNGQVSFREHLQRDAREQRNSADFSAPRRSRAKDAGEVIAQDVPALRIVPQSLWDRAKARQAALDARQVETDSDGTDGETSPAPFWRQQRPRYLFSGKMRCGACGGGFSKISAAHFGCSTAHNKGPTACTNLRTMRHDRLEDTVLAALKDRLMDPELYHAFAQAYIEEWNRLQAEASGDIDAAKAELRRIAAEADRLIDSIAKGTPPELVNGRLHQIVARRKELERTLTTTQAPAPRLMPNLADTYRSKVRELSAALSADNAEAAREQVRALVEAIVLIPEGDDLRIEVRGELGAIMRLGSGANDKSPSGGAEAEVIDMIEKIKLVAGAGFEPAAFRL